MTYVKSLTNSLALGDINIRGKAMPTNIVDNISSVNVDMSIDQVTELEFVIDDPEFKILKSGVLDLDTPISYRGLNLNVSVIETGAGAGLGGITVRCRPTSVRKLKMLRGKFTMNNVSPATYIKEECKKAGLAKDPVVQETAKKKRIARDVKEADTSYDPGSTPSAWTTFKRLADEVGCYTYEVGGTIYFGKPTWLVKKLPAVEVMWYPENGKEPLVVPEFRQSVDDDNIEISMELPIERAGRVFPGLGLKITDFPKYSNTYFINSVSYPLVGSGTVSIGASSVRDPEKVSSSSGGSSGGGSASGIAEDGWVVNSRKRGNNCRYTPRQMVERAYTYKGKYMYAGHCQMFIDVLGKGHSGGACCPVETWNSMPSGTPHGPEVNAPAGALVVWKHNSIGHIAISVGGGQMISTTGGAIRECAINGGYMGLGGYAGWMYPNLVGPP